MKKRIPGLAIACSFLLTCCGPDHPASRLAERRQSIINGTVEAGYPGVGALLIEPGGGQLRLCTAAAIADGWLLTSAGCIADVDPADVTFTNDNNIDSATSFYNIRALHPHSSFDAGTGENDIALLEVIGFDAATHSYNTDVQAVQMGLSLVWIGYGVSSTNPQSGSGVKRTGNGAVDEPFFSQYTYQYGGSMPCLGDGGGPAFAQIGGNQRIVGVISGTDENCQEFGVDTRVDFYQDWIAEIMSANQEEHQPDADGGQPDAESDGGEDAGTDAGEDAGEDAGVDAGVDAGEDAGTDAGADAGQDEPAPGDDSQTQDTTGPDQDQPGSSSGCSCHTTNPGPRGVLVLLAFLALIPAASRKRLPNRSR